jgi:tetratricopeptide (TPR) repeat protein
MQEAPALTTQELMDQSMEAFDAGNFEQAVKSANEVIAAAPEADLLAAAWFMKGVSNESLGNLPEAISAFTETTKLDPARAPAWYRLSKLLLAQGRFGEVVPAIGNAMTEASIAEDAEAVFILTTALNETGDTKGALQAIEEAGKLNPQLLENGGLLFQKGVAENVLGNSEKALEALTKAEALLQEPADRAYIKLQQGLAQQGLNQHPAAIAAFKEALRLMPPGEMRAFLWLHEARSDLALNDVAAANEAVNNAAKEPSSIPQFYFVKGTLLSLLGRNEEALADLEKATTQDRSMVQAWDQRAGLLIRLQRFAEALESLEKAIDLMPDGPARNNLRIAKAAVLLKKGDSPEALAVLDEAAKLDPTAAESLPFLEMKTQVLLALGRPNEIDKIFATAGQNPAIGADPTFQNLWANALLLAGNTNQATLKFESIAENVPANGNALAWLAHGNALSILGQFREALTSLDRARDLNPGLELNPQFLSPQLLSLCGVGRYEEALNAGAMLVKLDPANPVPYTFRGIALIGLERYEEARTEIKKALELAVLSPTPKVYESAAQIQLGWALVNLREFDEALVAFAKGADLAEELGNVLNVISALVAQANVLLIRSQGEELQPAEASQAEALRIATKATKLSETVRQGPVPGLAWWCKGNILLRLGRTEEALISYQRAAACDPRSARIPFSLGTSYLRLQDHEQAVDAFYKAAELAETDEEIGNAYLGAGLNLRLLERYEDAIEACRKAIRADGETVSALELLGRCYGALNRIEASLQTYRRGWGMGRHGQRSTACALGVSAALLNLKRNSESAEFLEKAEKETAFTGELHYNYGVALCRLKRFGSAATAFEKAAKMGISEAEKYADKLEGSGNNRTWLDFWFGNAAWMRKTLGVILIGLLVLALMPSFLKPDALAFLPWLDLNKGWQAMLMPVVLISVFLLLPILRRVSVKGMEFDISQPEPELARLDLATTLKAFEAGSTTLAQLGSQLERPDVDKALKRLRDAANTTPPGSSNQSGKPGGIGIAQV